MLILKYEKGRVTKKKGRGDRPRQITGMVYGQFFSC